MSAPFDPARVSQASSVSSPSDAFLPVLILTLSLLAWFGFQIVQLLAERSVINDARTAQEKPIQDSKKLRDSLDSIARGTALLADGGNPGARLIVDALKKRGVTITAAQPAGVSPPPTVQ